MVASVYVCPSCGHEYDSGSEAMACPCREESTAKYKCPVCDREYEWKGSAVNCSHGEDEKEARERARREKEDARRARKYEEEQERSKWIYGRSGYRLRDKQDTGWGKS